MASNFRVMYLDIEVLVDEKGVPEVSTTTRPVICITCYDNFLKRYIVFVWREDFISEPVTREGDITIHKFRKEEQMLKAWIKFVRETDPDVIAGWYVVDFDLRYLLNRMTKLHINYRDLSAIKSAYVTPYDVRIKGRMLFDLLRAYRVLHFNEMRSFKLDDVAREELGLGKTIKEGTDYDAWRKIGEIWHKDLPKLIKYNVRDVELCKLLDEKRGLIDAFDLRRRIAGCIFQDCFGAGKLIDNLILKFCHGKCVLPRKPEVEGTYTIKGAVVLEPLPGLKENVACFDVKSLYPSIIMSCNMSPETLSKDGEIILTDKLRFKKEKGIIPQVFDKLFAERNKHKELMKKYPHDSVEYRKYYSIQYSLKVLCNVIYGVMGHSRFRLFKPKVAEAVTFVGREIIGWLKEKSEKEGFTTIYGDTDSIFVTKEGATRQEFEKLLGKLNSSFGEFVKKYGIEKHEFKLELNQLFKVLLIGKAKKRYAGHVIWENGKVADRIEIIGLEVKRSDSSEFTVNLQRKVLDMILHRVEKKEIIEFIQQEVKKIEDGTYSIEYIGLPKGIRKPLNKYKANTPWVRGSNYANKYLGLKIGAGSKPKLIYVKATGKYPNTDVVCFNDRTDVPDDFVVDIKKMIDENVRMKLERIFETVGWGVAEIMGQKDLWSW